MAQSSKDRADRLSAPELWHREGQPIKLGCAECPERQYCGGLSTDAPLFNCLDLCCGQPDSCKRYICPNAPARFSKAVSELEGFELRPHRGKARVPRRLPAHIPSLLDRASIAGPLQLPWVAIPIYRILDPRTGLARFPSRDALLTYFRIAVDARLVITATGKDERLEPIWKNFQPKATAASLRALRPDLVATPNFSLHCDTVRHDNLVSLGRIAHIYTALANAGLPTALHVNGRTPHDFFRWTTFIQNSPGVATLAYELRTAGWAHSRRTWHVQQLARLAATVERPLDLIVQGGLRYLPELANAFRRVTYLDSTSLMKARHRQRAAGIGAAARWRGATTEAGSSIDQLLLHNVAHQRRLVLSRLTSASRWQTSVSQSG